MIEWKKVGKTVNDEGTTITYAAEGTDIRIESRKRHIPHAGGREGYWDHTTYWIVRPGDDIKECYSMKDAKEYVREYLEEGKHADII